MIRRYEADDIDNLLDIWRRATQIAHPFMSDMFLQKEEANIRDIYIPNTESWVCVKEGVFAGFTSVIHHENGVDEVGALFVDPKYHGQGLGYALMQKVVALYPELILDVFEKNAIGRRFYKRFGFQDVKRYLHPQTNEILCRLAYP